MTVENFDAKTWLRTGQGQLLLEWIRTWARAQFLNGVVQVTGGRIIAAVTTEFIVSDSFEVFACVDALVVAGELRKMSPPGTWGQHERYEQGSVGKPS